jgi:hypothetical protein
MIIAVPEGQTLQYKQEEGDWYMEAINTSGAPNSEADFVVEHGFYALSDEAGNEVMPSDVNFFIYAMEKVLSNCEDSNRSCTIDQELSRKIDFGDGYKILRIAYQIGGENDQSSVFFYESLLVYGDEILSVITVLNVGKNSAMQTCFENNTEQSCGAEFWHPASLMIATLLTTFSNLAVDDANISITQLEYDCENCNSEIDDTEDDAEYYEEDDTESSDEY